MKIATALCAALVVTALPAAAATGVAFVHGTGNNDDALNEYWTWEFIDSVRQGLPDPENYVVINCQFENFMWKRDAAGCLADQLVNFIRSKGIDDLVINTHSYGGTVMRWILSNPTFDRRYQRIIDRTRWVNGIAASSLGTPLADAVMEGTVFEEIVGWLLGYQNDGVRQQQVAWAAYYNANYLFGTEGRPRASRRLLQRGRHRR